MPIHGLINMAIKNLKLNKTFLNFLFYFLLLQIISAVITVIDYHGSLSFPELIKTMADTPLYFVFTNIIGIIFFVIRGICYRFIPMANKNLFLNIIIPAIILTAACIIGTKLSFIYFLYFFWSEWTLEVQSYVMRDNLIVTFTIFVSIGLYWVYKTLLEKKTKEIESLKRMHAEAKLAALQAKMNPHFLFNTLNSIIELGYKNPRKLEDVVTKLSNVFRKSLSFPDNALIPLSYEIELVTDYLEVEVMRLGSRLTYFIDIDEELYDFQIIPLSIETIVENAVIHGISPKENGGNISIRVYRENESVFITVSDNGVGINQAKVKSGFGTTSVRSRMNYYYGDKANFKLKACPEGGTCAIMEVPYEHTIESVGH